MVSNTQFDDLFALRVLLQDEFESESDIIRELKYELIQRGTPPANVPNYLKEFYESFGINMTIEQINEAIQPTQHEEFENQIMNMLEQMIGVVHPHPTQNQVHENINVVEEEEGKEQDGEEQNGEQDGEEQNGEQDGEEQNGEQDGEEQDGEDEDGYEDDNELNLQLDLSGNGTQSISSSLQFFVSTNGSNGTFQFNNGNVSQGGHPTLNSILGGLLAHGSPMLPPLIPIGQLPQMFNPLPPLLGPLFTVPMMGPGLHDVVTTLDDSDIDKLKVFKLTEKKEEKCSVCMTDMNTDEQVCELPCAHTFHDDCIEPWLKQYNYKCPICRKEVGKPKHNI